MASRDLGPIRKMTRAGREASESIRSAKYYEAMMKKSSGLNHGPYSVGEIMGSRDEKANPNGGSALLQRRMHLPLNKNAAGDGEGLGKAMMFAGKRKNGVTLDEH